MDKTIGYKIVLVNTIYDYHELKHVTHFIALKYYPGHTLDEVVPGRKRSAGA